VTIELAFWYEGRDRRSFADPDGFESCRSRSIGSSPRARSPPRRRRTRSLRDRTSCCSSSTTSAGRTCRCRCTASARRSTTATGRRTSSGGPRYKLIWFHSVGRLELYDLWNDTGESRNLTAVEPEVLAELLEKMRSYLERTGALLPRMKATGEAVPLSRIG